MIQLNSENAMISEIVEDILKVLPHFLNIHFYKKAINIALEKRNFYTKEGFIQIKYLDRHLGYIKMDQVVYNSNSETPELMIKYIKGSVTDEDLSIVKKFKEIYKCECLFIIY